jgi:hypothetical protein
MQQLRWSEDTLARADGTRDGCVEFVAGFAQARDDAEGNTEAIGGIGHADVAGSNKVEERDSQLNRTFAAGPFGRASPCLVLAMPTCAP